VNKTKADLESEVASLRETLARLERENPESDTLGEFKNQIAALARRKTAQHGWCGEVQNALNEVGIDLNQGKQRYRFTITKTWVVEAMDPNLPSNGRAGAVALRAISMPYGDGINFAPDRFPETQVIGGEWSISEIEKVDD